MTIEQPKATAQNTLNQPSPLPKTGNTNWYYRTVKRVFNFTVEGTVCTIGAYYFSYYILGLAYEFDVIDFFRNNAKSFLKKRCGRAQFGWSMKQVDHYLPHAIQQVGFVVGGTICYIVQKIIAFIWKHLFSKLFQKPEPQPSPEIQIIKNPT